MKELNEKELFAKKIKKLINQDYKHLRKNFGLNKKQSRIVRKALKDDFIKRYIDVADLHFELSAIKTLIQVQNMRRKSNDFSEIIDDISRINEAHVRIIRQSEHKVLNVFGDYVYEYQRRSYTEIIVQTYLYNKYFFNN